MQTTYFLLPPSEGKVSGGSAKPITLSKDQSIMYGKLQSASDHEKLLGVKGKALDSAVAANKQILKAKTLPAIERYSGVVFQGINYTSCSPSAKKFIDKHVYVVSALFGLVKSSDLIPEYKLKMSKLGAAKFWLPTLTKELEHVYVVDLLSKEYAAAVSYDVGIRIDFVHKKEDSVKPAGHFGKLIKGTFMRWCAENNATTTAAFKTFSKDGFSYDKKLSDDNVLIFSKSL